MEAEENSRFDLNFLACHQIVFIDNNTNNNNGW